jgi:hypothetical protein
MPGTTRAWQRRGAVRPIPKLASGLGTFPGTAGGPARRDALLTVQEGGVAACHGGVAKRHRGRAVTDDLLAVATGNSPVTRAGVNPSTITTTKRTGAGVRQRR